MIYPDRKVSLVEKKAQKTVSQSFLPKDIDSSILQTIDYLYPQNKIDVELTFPEFSCICPFSGLPDFATIVLRYSPAKKLVELKSLKYYFYAFRNVKVYNEHAINKIMEDLKKLLRPRLLQVSGEFTARGGITNKVVAAFKNQSRR